MVQWAQDQIDGLPARKVAEGREILRQLERVAKARGAADRATQGAIAWARGSLLKVEGKRVEAARSYEEAGRLYEAAGDANKAFRAHNTAITYLFEAERYDEALERARSVLGSIADLKQRATDPNELLNLSLRASYTERVVARVLMKRGEYRKALAALEPLVGFYASAGLGGARVEESNVLRLIAEARRKLGLHDEARGSYDRMARIAQELRDTALQSDLAFDVGEMYFDASRYADAQREFRKAVELAVLSGHRGSEARALEFEGLALWKMGQGAQALARLEEALPIRKDLGAKNAMAVQLGVMAKIRRDMETGMRHASSSRTLSRSGRTLGRRVAKQRRESISGTCSSRSNRGRGPRRSRVGPLPVPGGRKSNGGGDRAPRPRDRRDCRACLRDGDRAPG